MAELYSFFIRPGGTEGGKNRRLVQIGYGHRPYEGVTEYEGPFGRTRLRQRLLVENGASLTYERTDNGFVMVSLYPATSERLRRREDFLVYTTMTRLQPLTGKPELMKHWKYFRAYAEVTSLDGLPTASDHLRVWWLLLTCRRVIEGKARQPLALEWGLRIVGFSLVVGLSGFVLKLVELLGASK